MTNLRLNAKELRTVDEEAVQQDLKNIKRRPIYFILENIYDTYNIGGLFRLADAIGVQKMYICGQTEIPPNPKIKKASIGTYKVVEWEYKRSAEEAIADLKSKVKNQKSKVDNGKTKEQFKSAIKIIAVEQAENSVPYTQAEYTWPVAFILGNETYGVLPETLKLADEIVEIPMWGINKSLNVIVSAAIVSYWMMGKVEPPAGIEPAV